MSELVRYGENCKSAKEKTSHIAYINVTEAVFMFTLNSEKMTLWITFHKEPSPANCFSGHTSLCNGIF